MELLRAYGPISPTAASAYGKVLESSRRGKPVPSTPRAKGQGPHSPAKGQRRPTKRTSQDGAKAGPCPSKAHPKVPLIVGMEYLDMPDVASPGAGEAAGNEDVEEMLNTTISAEERELLF